LQQSKSAGKKKPETSQKVSGRVKQKTGGGSRRKKKSLKTIFRELNRATGSSPKGRKGTSPQEGENRDIEEGLARLGSRQRQKTRAAPGEEEREGIKESRPAAICRTTIDARSRTEKKFGEEGPQKKDIHKKRNTEHPRVKDFRAHTLGGKGGRPQNDNNQERERSASGESRFRVGKRTGLLWKSRRSTTTRGQNQKKGVAGREKKYGGDGQLEKGCQWPSGTAGTAKEKKN